MPWFSFAFDAACATHASLLKNKLPKCTFLLQDLKEVLVSRVILETRRVTYRYQRPQDRLARTVRHVFQNHERLLIAPAANLIQHPAQLRATQPVQRTAVPIEAGKRAVKRALQAGLTALQATEANRGQQET